MGKFITYPGRTFILRNGIKRKSHFLTNPSGLLLCDLEVDPKVHPQQLCLQAQLYISCLLPVTRNRAPQARSKGIESVKPVFLQCLTFILNFTKMTLNRMNCHVCFGFAWFSALLFNQPFTSNCCRSPLARKDKDKQNQIKLPC